MEASHYEAIANPDDPAAVKAPWAVRRRFILAGVGSAFAICAFIFWTSSGATPHSHAHTTSVANLGPLLLHVNLPYPEIATIADMVVCNYMGKPYTFTGEDDLPISTSGATGKYIVKINPVQIGEMCTTIPMAKTCESSTCWKRGTINGGDGVKQITAGVNVISRISAGESVCTVRCPSSRLLCEAQTVVFIAPVHCRQVKVLPSTEPDPEARLAPEQDRLINPYHALPSVDFPYPGGVAPTTVTICNYASEAYWYSWDDSTEKQWEQGPGHRSIPPLTDRSKACVQVETAVSWHRGFVAPCPKDQAACYKQNVRSITAGVNLIDPVGVPGHGPAGLSGECRVECTAAVSVCETATVVYIAPARCAQVQVTAH